MPTKEINYFKEKHYRNTGQCLVTQSSFSLCRGCLISFFIFAGLCSCAPPGQRDLNGSAGELSFKELEQVVPRLAEVRELVGSVGQDLGELQRVPEQLDLFAEVFQHTRANYITLVPREILIDKFVNQGGSPGDLNRNKRPASLENFVADGLKRMLLHLDPHSNYLNSSDYQKIRVRTRGEFSGIGIELTLKNGHPTCLSVVPGTPASRSNIEPGDIIKRIDGIPVEGSSLMQIVDLLRGLPGTTVTLTLARHKISADLTVSIVRDVIRVESVKVSMEGDIGYVRISTFNENTYSSLRKAVRQLIADFDQRMAGLVIDLRNNPGGLLDQALRVSDAFLRTGKIVSIIGRTNGKVRNFQSDSKDIATDIPLAVLINGSTASASEIVSGALKDRGRAILLGQRSYGKGSVQTIIPLSKNKGALRLTTARYYLPSGSAIQVHGVTPHVVDFTSDHSSRETDLENYLQAEGQDLPAVSLRLSEVCPDSGLANDPVLSCALRAIRSRLLSSISSQKGGEASN